MCAQLNTMGGRRLLPCRFRALRTDLRCSSSFSACVLPFAFVRALALGAGQRFSETDWTGGAGLPRDSNECFTASSAQRAHIGGEPLSSLYLLFSCFCVALKTPGFLRRRSDTRLTRQARNRVSLECVAKSEDSGAIAKSEDSGAIARVP